MNDDRDKSMINVPDASFVITKEYRRFEEFCNACKKSGYIGLCYGPPGVGKTESARRYTNSDFRKKYFEFGWHKYYTPPEVREYESIFYTAPVAHTPHSLKKDIPQLRRNLSFLIIGSYTCDELCEIELPEDTTKIIIVDECDRLTSQGIDYFRSIADEDRIAVIFMGMPGLEKRMARYAQLYSRVGFVHEFKPMSTEEVRFILEHKWAELGAKFSIRDFTDSEALAATVRITHGNFRLLQRLLSQVERVMRINELSIVTKEVIDAAREVLIIGTD